MLRLLLGMLVAATMVPVAAATTNQFAPSSVVLSTDPLETTLSWTRGLEAADSYRIYGLSNKGVPTFLVEIPADDDATWTLGDLPTFHDYGVSGVRGGVESIIQEALATDDDPSTTGECIDIDPDPLRINTYCGVSISIPPDLPVGSVKVPSPMNMLK